MAAKRNDPCPCGSGKKYKKCSLSKEEAAARAAVAEAAAAAAAARAAEARRVAEDAPSDPEGEDSGQQLNPAPSHPMS